MTRDESESQAAQQSLDIFADLVPTARYARMIGEIPATSFSAFVEADPAAVVDRIDPEAFFQTAYEPALARMIAHVVETEGPVRDTVLARRIARAHGWQRTGSRIQERVDVLAAKAHRTSREDVGAFYWPKRLAPGAPVPFRRTVDDATRTVDEICMAELTDLAQQILASGSHGEDAVVAMARELGMRRLGTVNRGRFVKALGSDASS